ncbi:unnamed protein product, partial [marine sediment metagenome]
EGTNKQGSSFRGYGTHGDKKQGHVDPNGFETVESWDCHPDCAIFILDQQSGELKSGGGFKGTQNHTTCFKGFKGNSPNPSMGGDSGGASR